MALVKCKECKAEISDQAKSCPQCGAKAPRKMSTGVKVVLGLVAIGVIGAAMSDRPAPKEKTAAEREADAKVTAAAVGAAHIKRAMKDPESFSLESAILMENGATCYEYRAKNSFSAVAPGKAVLTHDGQIVASGSGAGKLEKAWNAECGGKSGKDVTAGINFTL